MNAEKEKQFGEWGRNVTLLSSGWVSLDDSLSVPQSREERGGEGNWLLPLQARATLEP